MFDSNLPHYIYSFRLVQTRPHMRIELALVLCTVLDVLTFSILNPSWLVMDESFLLKRPVLLNKMTPVKYIDRMGTLDHQWFQTSQVLGLFEKKTRPDIKSWLEKRLVFLLVLYSPGITLEIFTWFIFIKEQVGWKHSICIEFLKLFRMWNLYFQMRK